MTPEPAPDRARIGARIRELREHKGLTQKQLAARAGVSLRALCYAEAGQVLPLSLTRKAIAEALGVADLEAAS